MSSGRAVEVRTLAADVIPSAGPEPGLRALVRALSVRIHEEALDLLSRGRDVDIRLHANEIQVNTEVGPIPVEARATVRPTTDGYMRVEIVSIRAASFLPIPMSLVAGRIEREVQGKPGIVRADGAVIDFDLGRVVREKAPVDAFPPLRSVRITPDWIDLEYAATPEAPV